MYYIVHFWDSIFAFLGSWSWPMLLTTFWFFFFIEVPRYYLFDLVIIVYRKMRWKYYLKKYQKAKLEFYHAMPFISILVPGKNEGKHIFKLVNSLREQTYKNFELIIVDDGSDDFTPQICRDLEKNGFIDRYLRNEINGGKASAANMGLYYAKGQYIVHLDADSSLDRDALEQILIPFYTDKQIKAVGATVKVRNQSHNLCTSLQALEYLETIMIGRMVTATLGIYRTISGAFGAFDTAMLRQVGGWDIGPGLDGDITQKIRKSGGEIGFAPKAICLTNVPTKFRLLTNQRLRWSKSLVRFRIRKHIDVLLPTQNFSFSNFFSNIENIIFNFLFDIIWLFYLINLLIQNQAFIIEIFFIKFCIMLVVGTLSFALVMWVSERKREEFPLISMVPFMVFYTGLYLRLVRIYAYLLEFFFFSSFRDPWNPSKSSRAIKEETIDSQKNRRKRYFRNVRRWFKKHTKF
ncbi:MAG: glycosyltransferase [Bacteroidales bacterium]